MLASKLLEVFLEAWIMVLILESNYSTTCARLLVPPAENATNQQQCAHSLEMYIFQKCAKCLFLPAYAHEISNNYEQPLQKKWLRIS